MIPTARGLALSLGALVAADAALDRLLVERLPARVAYQLARLSRLVKIETAYFHAQREAIIRDLGRETPASDAQRAEGVTTVIAVPPEHHAAFIARMRELAGIEITIDARPLALADLTVDVTGADLAALGPLVEAD